MHGRAALKNEEKFLQATTFSELCREKEFLKDFCSLSHVFILVM